jgi:hypothetical protein
MWNVVQFPQAHVRDRSSGVRVAFVSDRWCVECLEAGDVTMRSRTPSQADAQRIAARISHRDKVPLLPAHLPRRPARISRSHTPNDAA